MLVEGYAELLEAVHARRWRVLLVSAGKSRNAGYVYPPEVLQEAAKAGVFENVPARTFRFGRLMAHLPQAIKERFPEGFADTVVGAFVESQWSSEHQGVVANLELVEGAGWFENLLKLSHRLGGKLFGWSIDAGGELQEDGVTVKAITRADGVDFVTVPARGGRTLEPLSEAELMESFAAECGIEQRKEKVMKEKIRKLLERVRQRNAALLEGIDVEALVESEDLDKAVELLEAACKAPEPKPDKKKAEPKPLKESADVVDFKEAIKQARDAATADIRLESMLGRSTLPDMAKGRLRKLLEGKSPTVTEIQEAINAEAEYLRKATGGDKPERSTHITVLKEGRDKLIAGAAHLLECANDDEPGDLAFRSMQEAYAQVTGGKDPTFRGYLDPNEVGFEEAALASSTWTNVWETVGSRRLQKEFSQLPSIARRIASSIRGTKDFKNIEISNVGGFGTLAAVAEGADYEPLSIPGDSKVAYAVAKRGGTVQVTEEAMRADDVGGIIRMIQNAARSARYTEEYIALYSTILSNPTWADGSDVFTSGRGNKNTSNAFNSDPWDAFDAMDTALWSVALSDKRTSASDVEVLGLEAYHLIIGQASYSGVLQVLGAENKLVGGVNWDGSSSTEENYSQANIHYKKFGERNERVHRTPHLSSTSTTAVGIANPQMAETIEIAYLDNRREPELLRQQNPNVGSMFDNDSMKLKVRFVLGARVIDPRSFYGFFAS